MDNFLKEYIYIYIVTLTAYIALTDSLVIRSFQLSLLVSNLDEIQCPLWSYKRKD